MAMQTWLVLLLLPFFFSISVYSFISYLKDRRRQKLTFNDKRSMRRKIIHFKIIKNYCRYFYIFNTPHTPGGKKICHSMALCFA